MCHPMSRREVEVVQANEDVCNAVAESIIPGFKTQMSTHSMCAQESSLHIYHSENGYRITNVSI
jgi:hypothetical protein